MERECKKKMDGRCVLKNADKKWKTAKSLIRIL